MRKEMYTYEYAEVIQEQPEYLTSREYSKTALSRERREYVKRTKGVWINTNILLKKGWEGVKTGQTGAAGSCLSSLRDGIFIVVLNCKDN
jgi:D-alanyl-D-alanine carboxypeptidase